MKKNGQAHSLVESFTAHLCADCGFSGPEPDFQKWMENVLCVDLAIASDSVDCSRVSEEERRGWRLFRDAARETGELLGFYRENPKVFRKIARELSFLPCLQSWHPGASRFNCELLEFSQLGERSIFGELRDNPRHLLQQPWPVRYAYAIIATIDLTLDTYGERLPEWAEIYGYGRRHPIPMARFEEAAKKLGWDEVRKRLELPHYVGAYEILPNWTRHLQELRRPFNAAHVLDYWRVGKALILEEMPAFHERPEWREYRRRHYANGAKAGAVQHAIFKDILAALRTIAGANKRKTRRGRSKRPARK